MSTIVWKRLRFGLILGPISFIVLVGGGVVSLLRVDHDDVRYVLAGTRLLFGLLAIVGLAALARALLRIGRPATYDPTTMIQANGFFMEKDDSTGASLRGPTYLRTIAYWLIGGVIVFIPLTCVMVYFALRAYGLQTYE